MKFTRECETRIVIDGQEYHAKTAAGQGFLTGSCEGCAFKRHPAYAYPLDHAAMPCLGFSRTDKTSIIWVKA